jgi:hypothetical protein
MELTYFETYKNVEYTRDMIQMETDIISTCTEQQTVNVND